MRYQKRWYQCIANTYHAAQHRGCPPIAITTCLRPALQIDVSEVRHGAFLQLLAAAATQQRLYSAGIADKMRLTPGIEARLQQMQQSYQQLSDALAEGDSSSGASSSSISSMHKELSELQPLVEQWQQLQAWRAERADLLAMGSSESEPELAQLAQEELQGLAGRMQELESSLVVALLPRDVDDARDVILEVRPGTGGDEASLFAGDLLAMYQGYAAQQGWRCQLLEHSASEAGGCKYASAQLSGSNVYGRLKHEAGVHRVQRVPATESHGRVHTSTASVVVLPEVDEIDVRIADADVRVDVYRASGAGGQHVNTTDSAVRVTHLPTGLVVACQDERSQHQNRAKAFKILRARLYEVQKRAQAEALAKERRSAIGTGDRNERIRTYNYPQGRVTDHRVGVTLHDMAAVMSGEALEEFLEPLVLQEQVQLLEDMEAAG